MIVTAYTSPQANMIRIIHGYETNMTQSVQGFASFNASELLTALGDNLKDRPTLVSMVRCDSEGEVVEFLSEVGDEAAAAVAMANAPGGKGLSMPSANGTIPEAGKEKVVVERGKCELCGDADTRLVPGICRRVCYSCLDINLNTGMYDVDK